MGYEVKVASCEKELEPACIFLKQFEKGLAVCMELGNEEYVYHFNILRSLNEDEAIKLLEEVKKYFLLRKARFMGFRRRICRSKKGRNYTIITCYHF